MVPNMGVCKAVIWICLVLQISVSVFGFKLKVGVIKTVHHTTMLLKAPEITSRGRNTIAVSMVC